MKTTILNTMLFAAATLWSFGCQTDDAADEDRTGDAATDTGSETGDTHTETDTHETFDEKLAWQDDSTGLMWQRSVKEKATWSGAIEYCETLSLDGKDDWRLPGVGELKSLITECTKTADCEISDECTGYTSCHSKSCEGCPMMQKAVINPLLDNEGLVHWSATEEEMTAQKNAWIVNMDIGRIEYMDKGWDIFYARCVR